MGFFLEFPEILRIPLARWIDAVIDWILANLGGVLDAIGDALLQVLVALERLLLWLPWVVIVLGVAYLAWFAIRKWWAPPLMAFFLIIIGSFGYWDLAMSTLAIIFAAVLISLLIGIPTGIAMARKDGFANVLRPLLDAMQTMPSFVYLIPALMFFGLGKVPAVFATIIYAVPPVIRLTNVGIRGVSQSVVEAAQAFGATSRQILFEVQLPLAFPSIMVGINQTTMMALAMVVIASMIGAAGLGLEVLLSIIRIEVGRGFEAGLSIVLLAILIDRITHALAARQQYTQQR
jgi:glycine betaine/proline transport system permease protein